MIVRIMRKGILGLKRKTKRKGGIEMLDPFRNIDLNEEVMDE